MTPHTPRVPILLDKRRLRIKRVSTLRAEEVPNVPGGAAGDDDFRLDGSLARFASRGEEFVEVEVAVEAGGRVGVGVVEVCWFICGRVASGGFGEACGAGGFGLWVEGDAFEGAGAVVAGEAVGMEALGGGCDGAAGDGEGAGGALGDGAMGGGGPVQGGGVDRGCGGVVWQGTVGWERTGFECGWRSVGEGDTWDYGGPV